MQWFDVDKDGLAQLIERRGAASAVVELVQNALDTNATDVKITLLSVSSTRADLCVEDNDPDGFADLTHAFTLFAPSAKKSDAEKRGRFNLGEKLVLALCDEATVSSTKGTVKFSAEGRTELKRKRKAGSEFRAVIRLTTKDVDEVSSLLHRLILPVEVKVSFNGDRIESRAPEVEWRDVLPTEIANEDGVLRASNRKTDISLYRLKDKDDTPHLYELGIPVVEIDGAFHINVGQKVPLNFERSNVTPRYLRELQVSVINNASTLVSAEQAAKGWVTDALANEKITKEAIEVILTQKYGTDVANLVRYDPSDPESANEARSKGLTVVGGRAFTPDQWKQLDKAGVLPAAGKVAPSRNSVLREPEVDPETGEGVTVIPAEELSEVQQGVVLYVSDFASLLIGGAVTVEVVKDHRPYAASWGSRRLRLNATHLTKAWWTSQRAVDRIVLHECAHHFAADHLDHAYYEAVVDLAAVSRGIDTELAKYVPTVTNRNVKLKVAVD